MTIPHLLTACLWLLAAAAPAAGRPGPSARLLQQDPASSAAAPAYEAQARPAYFAGAGGSASASGPAAEQGPASHYRFADVGSASAAAVEGAIAAGDAGAFAAAAAAAGPEAAGRAVTEAIRGGRGPALAQLVAASGNAAATDAFLTVRCCCRWAWAHRSQLLLPPTLQGLWPAFCLDPPATAQTVVEAVSAGGAAASAAAHAAAIGARQCCGATRVALDRELPAGRWFGFARCTPELPQRLCWRLPAAPRLLIHRHAAAAMLPSAACPALPCPCRRRGRKHRRPWLHRRPGAPAGGHRPVPARLRCARCAGAAPGRRRLVWLSEASEGQRLRWQQG